MKKQFRKLSLALVFAMAVSLIAPAVRVADAAEKKTFTYAEQRTGDTVTTLVMDKGEKVDLKFEGVSNYKTYKYKWASSNTKVAVVDSNGLITAVGTGVATIKLTISGGDGTQYTSTGVTVYVGLSQSVSIGTAYEDEIKSYTVEMGKKATLKANGLKDNVGDRYTFDWSSTNTSVATISDDGEITPKAPGLTVIQLTVKKVFSGATMKAEPIALLVTEEGTYTPVATATPTPTKKPGTTATPTPTKKPNATATPIPTITTAPTQGEVAYTATLKSDNSLLLKFAKAVNYDISDVKLYWLLSGNVTYELERNILDISYNDAGTEMTVTASDMFVDGETYIIRVGGETNGKTIKVNIGVPTKVEVTYECLGQKGVAYAYDQSVAMDVPVTLSYRIYSGSVDVTNTYKNSGYMSYTFANSSYPENVSLGGDVVNFYAPNVTALIKATYTYYNTTGNVKDITATIPIKSVALPKYTIRGVVKYAIIDGSPTNTTKIDWDNPVTTVVAGNETAKLVVMLMDSYGNYFVTDERGVDKEKKIYYVGDYEQLFAKFGYSITFSPAELSGIVVNTDGSLYPYQALSNATAIVTVSNSGAYGTVNTTTFPCRFTVLAESKLTSIAPESSVVVVATNALPGYESRFCETDVKINLKDQYNNEWKGAYNLELSCSIPAINNALNGSYDAPARLVGNTLHINGQSIKRLVNMSAVTFVIKETFTNRTVTVTVNLQTPVITNNEIVVSNWSLGLQNQNINIGTLDLSSTTLSAVIEAYQLSSNGIKVGLYSNLHVLGTLDHQFTAGNCSEGEVYVLVLGPDGKPVQAGTASTLGVYVDSLTSSIKVNVCAPSGNGVALEALPEGTYTVRATRIVSTSPYVRTATLPTTSFIVTDNTREVTFRSLKSTKTPLTVYSSTDVTGVKAIIASVFNFNLDGQPWSDLDITKILNVEYKINGQYLIVYSVEFAVPIEGNLYGMTYKKTVKNINQQIRMGVVE